MAKTNTCLVTGGAGFIGCAISHVLAGEFDSFVVVDNLHPQVHPSPVRPASLHPDAIFIHGDVMSPTLWDEILAEHQPQTIIHLAAETGTGQSLSEASRHGLVNVVGTTEMLDALVRHEIVPEHFVLTSSRAVYGDGAWMRGEDVFYPGQRTREQLAANQWDFDGAVYRPASVASTVPHPTSVYGATKLAQEHILEAWATSFGSALSILRLQNVYGPGQSLINSYTGIVTLFARLAREKQSIPLYEDGDMLRDFVYIEDVARAIAAAIRQPALGTRRFDVGSGKATTIAEAAAFMANRYGSVPPQVCGKYRFGDVRHASCELQATLEGLSWKPEVSLSQGLTALCDWVDSEAKVDVTA